VALKGKEGERGERIQVVEEEEWGTVKGLNERGGSPPREKMMLFFKREE